MDEEDWIAQRAAILMEMALNVDAVEDKIAQDLMYRMMTKLVDSVIMPEGHKATLSLIKE